MVYFLAQSAVAIFHLEVINYIEHYGLRRRELAPGRFEPADSLLGRACLKARISRAEVALGWREIVVAECLEDAPFGTPQPSNLVYVMARGRIR